MRKPGSKAANRTRRWIANLLFVVGATLLGAWAWANLRGRVYQSWENWVFDRSVRGQSATIREYFGDKKNEITDTIKSRLGSHHAERAPIVEKPPITQPHVPIPAERSTALSNGELVGRLVLPRLHLRAMVREGTSEDTLSLALGHIPGTALPGQNGNVGVAGHRDTLFRSLREIRKNDLIQFQTAGGNYLYEVSTVEVVSPQSVGVLKASQYPEITLVTCYPFHYVGPAPDRFVVKAREVAGGTPPEPVSKMPREVAKSDVPAVPATQPAGTGSGEGTKRHAGQVPRKVAFEVTEKHSRELARGISFGLSRTDPSRQSVTGWMWVMPERRTIWLRNQRANEAVVFYGYGDGKARKLVITNVATKSVRGYLVVPEDTLSKTRTSN
jgi:sortase A